MQTFISTHAACRVRYNDLPGDGDPLVFIHGLGCASSYEYPRVIADSAFVSRRVILVDLPGSGFSERPDNYSYRTTCQSKVIIELVNYLGLEKFWLYGHSMGGSIAIEVAAAVAGRIKGLIVSEPNFNRGGGEFSRDIAVHSEETFVAKIYPQMLALEQSPWAGSLQSNAPWAVWRGAHSLVEGISPSWLTLFTQLTPPKLLVFGEHSLPDTDFFNLQQRGVATTVIQNAGHSMSWENPAALAKVLSDFCDQTR